MGVNQVDTIEHFDIKKLNWAISRILIKFTIYKIKNSNFMCLSGNACRITIRIFKLFLLFNLLAEFLTLYGKLAIIFRYYVNNAREQVKHFKELALMPAKTNDKKININIESIMRAVEKTCKLETSNKYDNLKLIRSVVGAYLRAYEKIISDTVKSNPQVQYVIAGANSKCHVSQFLSNSIFDMQRPAYLFDMSARAMCAKIAFFIMYMDNIKHYNQKDIMKLVVDINHLFTGHKSVILKYLFEWHVAKILNDSDIEKKILKNDLMLESIQNSNILQYLVQINEIQEKNEIRKNFPFFKIMPSKISMCIDAEIMPNEIKIKYAPKNDEFVQVIYHLLNQKKLRPLQDVENITTKSTKKIFEKFTLYHTKFINNLKILNDSHVVNNKKINSVALAHKVT